jgi:hypothetical protein
VYKPHAAYTVPSSTDDDACQLLGGMANYLHVPISITSLFPSGVELGYE